MATEMNPTGKQLAAIVCLAGAALVALYLCYLIAKPFLGSVLVSLMLAVVFYPIHGRIQTVFHRPNVAAAISTSSVLLVVTVPVIVLGISVSRELHAVVQSLREQSWLHSDLRPQFAQWVEGALERLRNYADISPIDVQAAMLRGTEQASRYLLSAGAAAVTNLFSLLLNSVVVFFSLFFFFREGKGIRREVLERLPLDPGQGEKLFTTIGETTIATFYGCLAVGAAQGTLTGLSFWVLGLSAPILWAFVTGLASLVPVVGSALVWGPAAVLLLLSGHWVKGINLLVWGAAVVGQVDVVVRPYVVSARVRVHTLLVFFALLGGVEAFGFIGIFVGPVILAITLAVLDLLRTANFWHWTAQNPEQATLNATATK